MDLALAHNILAQKDEYTQDGGASGVWSTIKSLFYIIFALLSVFLFLYATHLLFKCNILGEWTRAYIALSFVLLPVIAPIVWILFINYKPICKELTNSFSL